MKTGTMLGLQKRPVFDGNDIILINNLYYFGEAR